MRTVLQAHGVDDDDVADYIAQVAVSAIEDDDTEAATSAISGLLSGCDVPDSDCPAAVEAVLAAAADPSCVTPPAPHTPQDATPVAPEPAAVEVGTSGDGVEVSSGAAGPRRVAEEAGTDERAASAGAPRGAEAAGGAGRDDDVAPGDRESAEPGRSDTERVGARALRDYLVSDDAEEAFEEVDNLFSMKEPEVVTQLLGSVSFAPRSSEAAGPLGGTVEADGLEDSAGDVAPAVMWNTAATAPHTEAKVCRHFIEGHCGRSDCMFSHDLSAVPCRFFQSGSCRKGASCQFSHSIPAADPAEYYSHFVVDDEPPPRAAEPPPPKVEFHADAESFPALGAASVGNKVPKGATGGASSSVARAVDTEEEELVAVVCKRCPWAEESRVRAAVRDARGALTTRDAQLEAVESQLCKDLVAGAFVAPRPGGQGADGRGAASRHTAESIRRGQALRRSAPAAKGVRWVSTGSDLESQYKQLRASAIRVAEDRNRCFNAATVAFKRGDKARAKQLSREGRELDERMRRLHMQAAEAIFKDRNRGGLLASDKSGSSCTVDLHGLHKGEAVHFVEMALNAAVEQGKQWLVAICGVGRHSKVGRSQVLPTVKAWLSSNGYEFTESGTDGRGGVLQIRV